MCSPAKPRTAGSFDPAAGAAGVTSLDCLCVSRLGPVIYRPCGCLHCQVLGWTSRHQCQLPISYLSASGDALNKLAKLRSVLLLPLINSVMVVCFVPSTERSHFGSRLCTHPGGHGASDLEPIDALCTASVRTIRVMLVIWSVCLLESVALRSCSTVPCSCRMWVHPEEVCQGVRDV